MGTEKTNPKIQSSVPPYIKFVIDGLVLIKGGSQSDVISKMLDDWCQTHIIEIREAELTIAKWKEEEKKKQNCDTTNSTT